MGNIETKLTDCDLSVRTLNCLSAAEIKTIGDLVKYSKVGLLRFRHFGKKSLTELSELLDSLGLSFKPNIAVKEKFKIKKEAMGKILVRKEILDILIREVDGSLWSEGCLFTINEEEYQKIENFVQKYNKDNHIGRLLTLMQK